jgi:ankyrin repeat protein
MCGSIEIDGHAFCLGLEYLGTALEDSINQVAFLIQGAISRSKHISSKEGQVSLDICPLVELVDMYHAHEAKISHDKVYALLGMCSDNLSGAGLEPNYSIGWNMLMHNLVKFILGNHASIGTSNDRMAVVKIKGYVLGEVTSVKADIDSGSGQNFEALFNNVSNQPGCIRDIRTRWTLRASAKPIKNGDIICLFEGALKPTIIRLHEDHFDIIVVAAIPPKHIQKNSKNIQWPELFKSASFTRDFLVVWDWEHSLGDAGRCNTWLRTTNCRWVYPETVLEDRLDSATRKWDVSLILGDSGHFEKAGTLLQQAVQGYKMVLGDQHQQMPESQIGLTPLSWAAGNGNDAMVDLLLRKNNVNINLKDIIYERSALSWAAQNGHVAVVKLLLDTGKVEIKSKDSKGRIPLSWAVQNGHMAIVKLLLDTSKVEVNSKDLHGRTLLSWAAEGGQLAVVEWLLDENADVNAAGEYGARTALQAAAGGGHLTVVERLLEEKADVNAEAGYGGATALQAAAGGGHLAVVERLLEEKADVNAVAGYKGLEAVQAAARGRLLEEKADVNAVAGDKGVTALQAAAGGGHLAVVERLLEEKADVNAEAGYIGGRTALQAAAGGGHLAVVERLLEEKANVNATGRYGGVTALQAAAGGGHLAVVERLLEEKADVNASAGYDGVTALQAAAGGGHLAVVERLLEEKADVNAKAGYIGGRTALQAAAGGGHLAVVERLLEEEARVYGGAAEHSGVTALEAAAEGGHLVVLERLKQVPTISLF